MFDIGIGFSELIFLAVIMIIVVGPEELPGLLRTIGRYIGQVKRMATDFRSQVDEAIKDPIDELRTEMDEVMKDPMDEFHDSIVKASDGAGDDFDEDLIEFDGEEFMDVDEHNQMILDKEKADKEKAGQEDREVEAKSDADVDTDIDVEENSDEKAKETATEEELEKSSVNGLDLPSEPPLKASAKASVNKGGDVALVEKIGT